VVFLNLFFEVAAAVVVCQTGTGSHLLPKGLDQVLLYATGLLRLQAQSFIFIFILSALATEAIRLHINSIWLSGVTPYYCIIQAVIRAIQTKIPQKNKTLLRIIVFLGTNPHQHHG